jgi:hypothetical protein
MDEQIITREEALADPTRVNDLIAQLTGSQDIPVIADAPGDLITLPGGLHYNGQVYTTAKVKELTGSDEEALSKAIAANNGFHFMDTLLTRGVTHVGDIPATSDMLQQMLLGDRDELLIQIRVATYGEYFELEGWTCPHCGQQSDLKFSLANDIERIPLPFEATEYGEPAFEIELRRGAKALVRFPTGADQKACSDPKWTATERNSEMLRRCVKSITRTDGSVIHVQAFPGAIAEMNIPDRRKIVDAIGEKSPGPRYTLVNFTHAECQKDVGLALSMLDLFRDLLLGF